MRSCRHPSRTPPLRGSVFPRVCRGLRKSGRNSTSSVWCGFFDGFIKYKFVSVFILTGKRILRTSWSPAGVNSSVTRWESESVVCYSVAHFLWASVMHVCVCVAVTRIQWSVCPDPYTKASELSNRYLAMPLTPHHLWLINITPPFLHTLLLTLICQSVIMKWIVLC